MALFEPGTFFGWSIVRSSADLQPIHDRFETVSKWWLDLVPKTLMCAGLVYAASKAGSFALTLLAATTTGALCNYSMIYFNRHEIRFKGNAVSPPVSNILGWFMTTSVTILLLIWFFQAFVAVVGLIPSIKGAIG
jgi:hypothetical protein